MGTENWEDLGIDLTLPFHDPGWTDRSKEVVRTYLQHKGIIKNIYGHSLGANIITHLNNQGYFDPSVNVYTYNNPIDSDFTQMRANQHDYSQKSDIISIFDRYSKQWDPNEPWNPYKSHFTYEQKPPKPMNKGTIKSLVRRR